MFTLHTVYVVIAFPDREFALHMFTVGVPEAAVSFSFFFQSWLELQIRKFLAHAKGTLTGDEG